MPHFGDGVLTFASSASVGVATTRPGRLSKRDIERLLARQIAAADAAMYAAKRLGGDRASVAS